MSKGIQKCDKCLKPQKTSFKSIEGIDEDGRRFTLKRRFCSNPHPLIKNSFCGLFIGDSDFHFLSPVK